MEFNEGKRDPMYISERHDSNNILSDVQNIENLEKNEERNLKPYLIKIHLLIIIIKSKKCMKIYQKLILKNREIQYII